MRIAARKRSGSITNKILKNPLDTKMCYIVETTSEKCYQAAISSRKKSLKVRSILKFALSMETTFEKYYQAAVSSRKKSIKICSILNCAISNDYGDDL